MGPITYSLCKSQGIGLLMLVTGLCAFPPVVEPTPVSLAEKGTLINKKIEIPVTTDYLLRFEYYFNNNNRNSISDLVGNGVQKYYCNGYIAHNLISDMDRDISGVPVPLRVVLTPLGQGRMPVEKEFYSVCKSGHSSKFAFRDVGELHLERGGYHIELYNLNNHPELKNIRIDFSLVTADRF